MSHRYPLRNLKNIVKHKGKGSTGKIIVEVMSKPEILDPQGKATKGSLARLGITSFEHVCQGKRFELVIARDVTETDLETTRGAAETLLSNPTIEDVISVGKDAWIHASGQ